MHVRFVCACLVYVCMLCVCVCMCSKVPADLNDGKKVTNEEVALVFKN
jgi:hypothetical protein